MILLPFLGIKLNYLLEVFQVSGFGQSDFARLGQISVLPKHCKDSPPVYCTPLLIPVRVVLVKSLFLFIRLQVCAAGKAIAPGGHLPPAEEGKSRGAFQ